MVNSKKNLNFIFWGTPDVAKETLDILKENGYLPSLIVTSTDKPQGRKMILTPPPVKVWAIENNIPYIQPEILSGKDLLLAGVSQADEPRGSAPLVNGNSDPIKVESLPDLSIVVAYGKIIPEEILNMPKFGSINIHYSLLPKYRGASPVESAILNGDKDTGVTIQKMEYKMDTGPIISTEKTEILPTEKASELRKRLIKIGGDHLVKTLPKILDNTITLTPQKDEDATYCKKIKKEDGLIDLNDDAQKNYNKFRAYSTWPRSFFFLGEKRIIITDAILENNLFTIKKIIPESGKETSYTK
ncbi:MAG: methionyl-tRNA formyltransferase [Burkholderiales bacterium]|nr:methionyl-tRNA formyltransferase [Burkholderiales bacterium]